MKFLFVIMYLKSCVRSKKKSAIMGTVLCLEDALKVQIISKKIHRFLIAFHGLLLETIARMHSQDMALVRHETSYFFQ